MEEVEDQGDGGGDWHHLADELCDLEYYLLAMLDISVECFGEDLEDGLEMGRDLGLGEQDYVLQLFEGFEFGEGGVRELLDIAQGNLDEAF